MIIPKSSAELWPRKDNSSLLREIALILESRRSSGGYIEPRLSLADFLREDEGRSLQVRWADPDADILLIEDGFAAADVPGPTRASNDHRRQRLCQEAEVRHVGPFRFSPRDAEGERMLA
jgi:hypothetical protein